MVDGMKPAGAGKGTAFPSLFKFALGLAFLVLGGVFLYKGWDELFIVLKGVAGAFCILAGIVVLAIARN